jgi:hypothetical protein
MPHGVCPLRVPFIFPAPKSAMDAAEQPTLVEEDVYHLTAQSPLRP